VARLLPPESSALELVARDVGIGAGTLARWREEIQSRVSPVRRWTADTRLDAVITTAAMDEVSKSAWCREHGVFPVDLDRWRATATAALGVSGAARTDTPTAQQDRRRIKELERNLLRKDRALAETAALLVLSKKVGAIFHMGEDA
jgi:Transposase.